MFFSLIDYAGRQATSKINLLDVEGQTFDDQWRKAHIPLSAFRAASRGVNLENIKELRIEFQREGCVHLDGIRIVPFEHQGEKFSQKPGRMWGSPAGLGSFQIVVGHSRKCAVFLNFWSECRGVPAWC